MNYVDKYPQCSDCIYLTALQVQRDAHTDVANTSEITGLDIGLDIISTDITADEMNNAMRDLSTIIDAAREAGTLSTEAEERYAMLMANYGQQLTNLAMIAQNLSSVADIHIPIIEEMLTIVHSLDESASIAVDHCDTTPRTRAVAKRACFSALAFTQQ